MIRKISLIFSVLFLFACGDFDTKQPKPDSAKPKTTSSDSAKPKTTSTDPAKPKTTSSDPAKPKATSSDPAKPKTTSSDPAKPKTTSSDPAKPKTTSSDPAKPKATSSDPAKPKATSTDPLAEVIPPHVQAFFDDPEIQLLNKTAPELEAIAQNIASDIRNILDARPQDPNSDEKFVNLAIPLLKIRILQNDDTKASYIAKHIVKKTPFDTMKKLIKDMQSKYYNMSSTITNDNPNIDFRTKNAYHKLNTIAGSYNSLLDKIKANLTTQAIVADIDLPDF